MKTPSTRLLLVLTLSIAAAGCGSDDEPSDAGNGGAGQTTSASGAGAGGGGGEPSSTSSGASGGASAGGMGGGGGRSVCPGAGKALEFDGDAQSKVTADLVDDLPTGNDSRTVELWAYFSGDESWRPEHSITEYGMGTPNHVFGIDVDGYPDGGPGRLDPYTNGDGDLPFDLSPAVPKVGWLHLAWTYDGATHEFRFTVDGVVGNSKTIDHDLPTTASPIAIGAANVFGNEGFTGKIDEYRVWNVARTEAEIAANKDVLIGPDEPGLVAYYHFDEGSGTTAEDAAKGHTAMFASDTPPVWVDSDLVLTCP